MKLAIFSNVNFQKLTTAPAQSHIQSPCDALAHPLCQESPTYTQREPSFNIQNPTGTFSPGSVLKYRWPYITAIVTISVQPGLMPLLTSGGHDQFSTWCPGHDSLLNSYFLDFCTSTILRACFVAPLIIILHTCVVHLLVPPAPSPKYPSCVCYIDPLSTLLPLLET